MGALEDDLLWVESLENYLSQQKGGADLRAAEIEKLASQCEKAGDHPQARRIRFYTSADYVRSIARECRAYITHGKVDKVYGIRTSFERNRLSIEALLDQQHIGRGRKVSHDFPGANKGGQKSGTTTARDVRLAKQFQEQLPKSKKSPTALKEKIGKAVGLGRSQSVEAINRGLKKLSDEPA